MIDFNKNKFLATKDNNSNNLIESSKKEIRMILTEDCNYDCSFCHKEWLSWTEKSLLNADDYKFVYNAWKESFGFDSTSLSGWEPLMRKDIIDIARGLKEEWAHITLVSNGALLNQKSEIGEYVDRINVSIHSLEEKKHKDLIGRNSSIEKVVKGIKKIRELYSNVEIRLNTALMKWINAEENDIINYIKFAQDIGSSIKYIELYPREVEWFVDISYLENLLLNYWFTKEEKWNQTEFNNWYVKVISTTCFRAESWQKEDAGEFCNKNNDIFLAPNGNIRLCKSKNNQIELLDFIKNKDIFWFRDRIYEVLNCSGTACSSTIEHASENQNILSEA